MLEFTLSMDREVYIPGESIVGKLTLRNTGSEPVVVNSRLVVNSPFAPQPLRDVIVTLTDRSGAVAKFAAVVDVGMLEDQDYASLNPGETFERSLSIDLFYALERPGTYSVQALYQNDADPGDGRRAWKGELTSNAVTFTLES